MVWRGAHCLLALEKESLLENKNTVVDGRNFVCICKIEKLCKPSSDIGEQKAADTKFFGGVGGDTHTVAGAAMAGDGGQRYTRTHTLLPLARLVPCYTGGVQ